MYDIVADPFMFVKQLCSLTAATEAFRLPVTKPMSRAPENPVAMRSTQAVIDCRLEPIGPDHQEASNRPVWLRHVLAGLPPISDEAKAVHHEAIVIRKLARALCLWLALAREQQAVVDEPMCCEFVRLMRDLERQEEQDRS